VWGQRILKLGVDAQPKKIRIFVVDDHAGMREGISALINSQLDMMVVGEAASGPEAVKNFAHLQPGVTVVDVNLPGFSGISAIIQIRATFPTARFVVITASSDDEWIHVAFKAGAGAFLYKHTMRFDLLPGIRAIAMGQRYIPDSIAKHLKRLEA